MDKDTALDLALEALEKSLPRLAPYGEQDWLDSRAAITAIKQARSAPVQPVAWPAGLIDRIKAAEQRIQDGHAPRRIPADPTDVDLVLAEVRYLLEGKQPPFWIKTTPLAQPAPVQKPYRPLQDNGSQYFGGSWDTLPTQSAPVQEPVAWMTINAYGEEDDIWYENPEGHLIEGWTYKPLYAHPAPVLPVASDGDPFLQGVCVALQTLTAHGDGVIWREIVEAAGADALFQFAAHIEPEEWELAGFGAFAKSEMGRDKPKKLAPPEQPAPAVQEPVQGPSGDYLSDFQEGQWWLAELDAAVVKGTPAQRSAVAVVRNLLATVAANTLPAAPVQKPVGEWVGSRSKDSDPKRIAWKPGYVVSAKIGDKLYTTPPAQPAPAQPAPVPVEWMEMVTANLVREGVNKHKARELAEHFYTTPPAAQRQWVPVTKELLSAQHPWLYESMWIAMKDGSVMTGHYAWMQGRYPDRFLVGDCASLWAFEATHVMPMNQPKHPAKLRSKNENTD